MQKLLIIDDNHSFIDSVKVILKELPMKLSLSSCDRYSAARKLLEEAEYDLILLDNETETSQKGTDFVESILRSSDDYNKESFIVFSSRLDSAAAQLKALGVRGFSKPFKIPEFQQYISKVLIAKAQKKVS